MGKEKDVQSREFRARSSFANSRKVSPTLYYPHMEASWRPQDQTWHLTEHARTRQKGNGLRSPEPALIAVLCYPILSHVQSHA